MNYKYTHLIPENIAPVGADKIVVRDGKGKKVCDILLGRLKQPTGSKLYSFCAVSDIHLTYDTANADFQRALTYAESNCDFTCIAGDLTSTGGDESQLALYKNIVDTYAKTKPVYGIAGNHEHYHNYSYSYWDKYVGHPLYYSFTKGDDVFIMIGHYGGYHGDGIGWLATETWSVESLQWLFETLEENRNKRCFVFTHVLPHEHGVGNPNNLYVTGGKPTLWYTTDGGIGQAFMNLLRHYKNTILFHGHSHTRFWLQELDEKANYSNADGYRSVHIPSLSVPRDPNGTGLTEIYAESEGYIVDVYDDYIVLNGRDFIDNDADGHIIPLGTYKIDTSLVEVEAGTFTDDTGILDMFAAQYQRLSYIGAENGVGAYIDLGLKFDTGAIVEIEYVEDSSNTGRYIFGAAENSGKLRCMITEVSGTQGSIGYGSTGSAYFELSLTGTAPNDKFNLYRLTLQNGLALFENVSAGTYVSKATQGTYTMASNLYLFAQNYNGAMRYGNGYAKIKSFKYYDKDGNLICDLIPCYRKADGEVGMYDDVRKIFLENIGDGAFIRGEEVDDNENPDIEVVAEYQQLEYITAPRDVKAYIDLGFPFDTKARIEMSQYISSVDAHTYVFGAAENSGVFRCMFTSPNQHATAYVSYPYGSNGSAYIAADGTYTINEWNYFTLTFEEGNLRCYNSTTGYDGYNTKQASYSMTNNLYLFAQNYNGTARFGGERKIGYFRYYDKNNAMVCDLVPCIRQSDKAIGMYDKVTKTFFSNAGTASFIAGPVVCDGILENYANPSSPDWKTGYRLNSSGGITEADGIVATNYIGPLTMNDVVTIEGMNLTTNTCHFLKADKTLTAYGAGTLSNSTFSATNITATATGGQFTVTSKEVVWCRFCGALTGTADDVVITINCES